MSYYYYITELKEPWKAIPESEDIEERLKELKAKHCTILSVSEIVKEDTNLEELKYKGPLYFDIDLEGEVEKAIESCRNLVDKLINVYEVPENQIKIYCSGSKGFHVIVHEKTFSSGRPTKLLPRVYAHMASEMDVEGLDFAVYSAKRGRMWRLPNIQRDNGKYKVEITLQELQEMDKAMYEAVCSSPRPLSSWPATVKKSEPLKKLFDRCKSRAHNEAKKVSQENGFVDEDLEVFGDDHPNCVKKVLAYEGLKPDTHFNNAVVQFSSYLANRGLSEDVKEQLIREFASNSKSSRHPTDQARYIEVKSKVHYTRASGYKFLCSGMISILEENPCEGCPLRGKGVAAACSEFSEPEVLGILAAENGYYKDEVQLSTFTMVPRNLIMFEMDEDEGGGERVKAIEVDIYSDGEPIQTIKLTDEAFTSKQKFLSEIQGISKAVFMGSEQDLQKIKYHLHQNKEKGDVGRIIETYTAGINTTRRDSTKLVYVEPNYSVDYNFVTGTHKYVGNPQNAPCMHTIGMPPETDDPEFKEFYKTIECLLDINNPAELGLMLGWFSICHLRKHLELAKSGSKEFPILFIYGNAGSGKTQTASLLSYLHNVDYMATAPTSVASITEWALIETISSTTTVPVILDEFNKHKLSQKAYNSISEKLKMAWGSQVISRGTIKHIPGSTQGRTGARTVNIPISSPLVVISEQAPQESALIQRGCLVHLTRRGRSTGNREQNFIRCRENRDHIRMLGRAMVFKALMSKVTYAEELKVRYKDVVDNRMQPRPRLTLQLILGGLDFLKETLKDLDIDLSERIEEIKGETIKYIKDKYEELLVIQNKSEVDRFLATLSIMATMKKLGQNTLVEKGRTYLRADKLLYLDLELAVAAYIQYCSATRQNPVMENVHQLAELIKQEDYCLGLKDVCDLDPTFGSGGLIAVLDVQEMQKKKLSVKYFEEGRSADSIIDESLGGFL
jgi:hypothetical protein